LYSTANERGFDLKRFFVCLSANSRQDARDPSVSPAKKGIQALKNRIRRRIAGVPPAKKGMQALKDRTRRRIAGVSPARGCTQPLMSEVLISNAFLFVQRRFVTETVAFLNFCYKKLFRLSLKKIAKT
jgi:hypothetical protein